MTDINIREMKTATDASLLIIENSAESSRIYQNYLRSTSCGYNLSIVTSIAEGLDLCRTSNIDTVLLGGSISDIDGLAFLELLAAQSGVVGVASPRENRPTVIMVATEGDPRIAVRAIKLGAQDYLLERDLTPELLQSAVACGIEKARLQLQLQECNDRFRIAIDNVLDCIAIFSAIRDETGQIIDFRFDYLNPSALASNQMTAADTHRSLCEVLPSVRETGLFVEYCRVVETGEPLVQDNLIYSDTFGTQYLTKVYDVRIVKLDDGFIATWRDVTERRQTEIAFQESEERLRLATDAARLGTFDWDIPTQLVTWNRFHRILLGYTPELSSSFAAWERRVHPDDLARVTAALQLAQDSNTDYRCEYRVIWEDDSLHWLAALGRFYYDSDNRPLRMTGIIQDITDRKQAELALQASEQRYRALIDVTTQIVWNADADGTILNSNFGTFARQSLEEYQGWGWMEAIHPDDRQRTSELWLLAVANLTRYEIEHRVRRWDGEYRLMSVRAVPLLDNDGSVREWVGLHTDITEVRQDEENLRRSEEFNRRILENNQDCIKVLDLEGRLLYMNDNGQKLLEIADFADCDRSLWTQFWGGREQELAQAALADARDGTVSKFEGQCSTTTGTPKWWEVSVIPLHDEDGNVEQILSISHDLTERMRSEAAIKESERKFSAIFDQTFEFIGMLSLDGVLLEVNQAALDSVGTSRAEIVGKNFWETRWWTHSQELQQQLRQSIARAAQGELICYEVSFPTAHGEIMITNFSLKPVLDEFGQVTALVCEGYDITHLKRTEAALLESEERFRSTFELAAVGIAHVALDGQWLLFNPKLCEICGYTQAELLDLKFQDITHPDDLTQDLESIRQILADEIQLIELDKRYIHKLGHIVWISLTGMLLRDPSGAPLYFIASIEDISHRKHSEFALQAQAVKLAETTALVELRNQELNRFSHTVSHDLKAPLRGISNLAAWIRDDLSATVNPDILTNLELMRTRISRMDSLIDGSLEYARVGSTAASLETFSVEQLLAEIVDSLSIPNSFVVELPAELRPITTNRVLLSQVLANLIGNAYKHHDRPDGRIQVTAQPDAEMWGFSVTDDGHGIAPENQAQVFDIFKTLSGTDKNNTGIGLSIVKKLVETQGGKITLESQPGMGTTFSFTWIAEI